MLVVLVIYGIITAYIYPRRAHLDSCINGYLIRVDILSVPTQELSTHYYGSVFGKVRIHAQYTRSCIQGGNIFDSVNFLSVSDHKVDRF